MTDTEILGFIRTQFEEEGITWKSEQELFEMLIPKEAWDDYRTNWDNWKHLRVHNLKRSPNIRVAISKTLNFPIDLWDHYTDNKQRRILHQCIQKFAVPGKDIDLSSLIPSTYPMTKVQEDLIQKVINVHRKDEIELLIQNLEHFHPAFETQAFLLKLIPILYDQGHYDFLHAHAFPALLAHNKTDTQIKILMAHTLGSLSEPKYIEAAKLLEVIPSEEDARLIDLKTAAISNVRRQLLTDPDLTKKKLSEILDILLRYYHDAFTTKEIHHYYPGINLAYILYQYEAFFPYKNHNCPLTIHEIYQYSKASIQQDVQSQDEEAQYYAKISELELMLLLNRENVESELYLLLENTQPPYDTVKRTIRQMQHFIALNKKFSVPQDNDLISKTKYITELLEEYINTQKK